MCKAKGNIQLSGLSSERRGEHQRQNLIHSWIFWNCSNYTNKRFANQKDKKSKADTGRAECTQRERLLPSYCSATAQCSPVQSVGFRLASDCPLVCPVGINPVSLRQEDC